MRRVISTTLFVLLAWGLLIVPVASAANPFLPNIPKTWTQVSPDTHFQYNGLKPSCAACPFTGCDTDYSFFVKGGTTNNLVIYFEGGGACWDSRNCLYPGINTYSTDIPNISMFSNTTGAGIFDTTSPLSSKNPFKDWYFVFIPYCTGDIHWGANDYQYPDIYGAYGGRPQTIRHRGFVNFMAVLDWVKKNFKYPMKIFVTGSSAGGYGAIMGFPYVKQAYPLSQVYELGDAANWVIGGSFETASINNWNIQLPRWIPGFQNGYVPGMEMSDVYIDIARYYPLSKLAQFATAWDYDQTLFYNVMLNITNPNVWGDYQPEWCPWHFGMLDQVYATADARPNYRYYIAAGYYHTIMMSPEFYTENSGGVSYADWVSVMVNNPFGMFGGPLSGIWRNRQCTNCQDTPLGESCPQP
jgi:hypothetical protein